MKQNFEAENLRRPTRYNFYDWPEHAPGHTAAEKGNWVDVKRFTDGLQLKGSRRFTWMYSFTSMTNRQCLSAFIPDNWSLTQIYSDSVDRGCGSCPSLRLCLEFDLSLPCGDCYLGTFETKAWKLPGADRGGRLRGCRFV